MSRQILTDYDFNKNQAKQLRLDNQPSHPSSPVPGQIYFNTTDGIDYIYNGTVWKARGTADGAVQTVNGESGPDVVLSAADVGADAAGSAATAQSNAISSANGYTDSKVAALTQDNIGDGSTYKRYSAVEKSKLAGIEAAADVTDAQNVDAAGATMNTDTDISGNAWFLNEPTMASNSSTKAPSQASVKAFAENLLSGLSWKKSVRVATTANGALATAFANGQAIDGVTLATGDRILIKNQTTGSENGLYTVNASGAPTRSTDADTSAELRQATVVVEEGTTNQDTQWTMTNNGAVTIGTTALVFVLSGTGSVAAATTSAAGKVQLATAAEAEAKSNTAKALTPSSVANFGVKKSFAVGNGSATSIALTHNLNTRDVIVDVYDATTYESVEVDVVRTDVNTVTLTFATAPANNAYRAVVI